MRGEPAAHRGPDSESTQGVRVNAFDTPAAWDAANLDADRRWVFELEDRARRDPCRKTLEPLAADAVETDAALSQDFLPNELGERLPIIRAAPTHLELCQEQSAKSQ